MATHTALIVAAGRGRRFGGETPKQYLPLLGHVVLEHTLRAFSEHPQITAVQTVIHPDDIADFERAAVHLNVLPAVFGGETRQESVHAGLEALAPFAPDTVLVHDGARPNASDSLVARVIEKLDSEAAVIPVIPVADTLKSVSSAGEVTGTVDRSSLIRAQTPQGFHFNALRKAHERSAGSGLTDDAGVMEAAGHRVVVVPGDEDNLKITTPEDLTRMTKLLSAGLLPRTGQGFDVHAFEPGDHVTLCGIDIPHDQRLAGHSDADVALHAVTDAILGAMALGDIGDHFPPSDPQWKGAASHLFLEHAVNLVHGRGGLLHHIDLTLMCEAPKIGPHRASMRTRLAEICGISVDAVSVKATTTERLGFTGRREGIACLASVTVLTPGV